MDDPAWLQSELAQANVVDTRSPADFGDGHIPGARNLSVADIKQNPVVALGLPSAALIVIHGWGGPDGELFQAAYSASQASYTNVRVFSAGIDGWVAAGYGLE